MAFRHILVAVDSDSSSAAALGYSAKLAHELGARLSLLHVWEAPPYVLGTRAPISGEELLAAATKTVQETMDAHLAEVRRDVPEVTGTLRRGDAAEQILAEISAEKPDLVVMGSHGRGGVSRAVLGSVAAEIVRRSPAPVLVFGPATASPAR